MFQNIKIFLYILIMVINANLSIAQEQSSVSNRISDQVIVRMQKGVTPYNLGRMVSTDFELNIVKVLSQHSDIWLLEFNDENTDVEQVLIALMKVSSVLYAQSNKTVELRAAPNDPDFGNQWQHNNIQSQSAWDITTGGSTPGGTDVVVALIESADLINHEDLKDNQWVNTAEIPNNGIDDDGNGYIDDYNGWNVSTNNDNIGTGSHGTSCAGMIGAKGNNGIGVSGINWDVKIMDIAGYDNPFTEANIVEAYNYALQARLLWNQTQGAEGAFVVATSASWGIDRGDPNDSPIWCGFYEDLGEAGILNCGATTNQNLNVDVEGDVPSACPSNYMISVTSTNQSDIINSSGYGQTTIDVGAPGAGIYTTSPNNGYGSTSGTSFATPLTAGLIGLMYSIPCEKLEALAKADPQNTADIVRQALLDGVDQNGYLMTRTVTGGRINAKNAIDTLMARICNTCLPTSNVTTTSIGEDQGDIQFNKAADTSTYQVYIRIAGTENWTIYTTPDTTYSLTGLTNCTDYEYTVSVDCNSGNTNGLSIQSFRTLGCGNCVDLNYCATQANNPNVLLNVISPSSIEGEYTFAPTSNFGGSVSNGYVYGELVVVNDGSTSPVEGCNALTNASEVNNNIAVIMRGNCNFTSKVMNAQNAGAIAAIIINNVAGAPYEMGGSNNGITIPAIMISQSDGNTLISSINNNEHPKAILGQQNEWIASFKIDGNTFSTGDNNGYVLTEDPFLLVTGQTYSFTIEPGFGGQPLEEYYRIWLDIYQDGDFTQSDIIYDSGTTSEGTVTGSLTIPITATLGSTRMRVQMAYQGFSSSTLPGECGDYISGEVEDYCVTIDDHVGLNKNKPEGEITIYPNPARGYVRIDKKDYFATEAVFYNPNGQIVNTTSLNNKITNIDIEKWSPGIYFVHILDKDGGFITVQKISILP